VGDRTPSPINLSKLCDFFNTTPNYFYGQEESGATSTDNPRDKQMILLNGYSQNLTLEQLKFLVMVAKEMSGSSKD